VKYALLIYSATDAEEYAAPSDKSTGEITDYFRELKAAGVVLGAEQLTHSDTATSVRVRGTDRLLTDGPYLETKEHLLGFILIDVPDLDAALDWAARMPIVSYGTVEVRAVTAGGRWREVLA
jgi:hypothetical protein